MSAKSRSTQQRRVKGQQASDRSALFEDPMLELPSSNSGLMFLQQLQRHSDGVGSAAESSLPLPSSLTDEETAKIRAHARATVVQLFQEKGDAGVQAMLQQEIQATKKKESDIAVAKKRGEAAAREKDQLTAELHRISSAKTNVELHCKGIQADIKKQDEEVARATVDLAANREEARARIEKEVSDLEAKMKAMEAEDGPLAEENAKLREETQQLKQDFDITFKEYEASWAEMEKSTSATIRELQEAAKRTELLDAKLLLAKREAQMMTDSIAVLKEQVRTYEERFSAFEDVAVKSDEVERVTEMQRAKLAERIASADKEKDEAHEIRVQLEKETVQLKSKLAALKKKLPLLEKSKAQLESKCRAEQQKR